MARWNDVITLIKPVLPEGRRTDSEGFSLPPLGEIRREVFCNKRSVGYSEFYKAQQTGYTALLKIDMYSAEYAGEETAELEGKRYGVLRTYESKSGEIIELTLTDLPLKSVLNPPT